MQLPIPESVRDKGPQQIGEWKVGDRLMDKDGELATIWWFYDCPTAYVKWDNGCYGSIQLDEFDLYGLKRHTPQESGE